MKVAPNFTYMKVAQNYLHNKTYLNIEVSHNLVKKICSTLGNGSSYFANINMMLATTFVIFVIYHQHLQYPQYLELFDLLRASVILLRVAILRDVTRELKIFCKCKIFTSLNKSRSNCCILVLTPKTLLTYGSNVESTVYDV